MWWLLWPRLLLLPRLRGSHQHCGKPVPARASATFVLWPRPSASQLQGSGPRCSRASVAIPEMASPRAGFRWEALPTECRDATFSPVAVHQPQSSPPTRRKLPGRAGALTRDASFDDLVGAGEGQRRDNHVPKAGRSARRLPVEPDVFHTPAVVNAVDHQRVAPHIGVPTRPGAVVPEDRPRRVFRQLAFDRPHQLLALLLVEFHRLLVDHLVELWITVAIVVALSSASEILIQSLVRVIEAVSRQIETDGIVATHDLGKPLHGVDHFKLAVDVDLLQLVDQDYCRIPVRLYITRRYLDCEPLAQPIAVLLHEPAGSRTVLQHIWIVAGQCLQQFRRHPPYAFGWRLHNPAKVALVQGEGVDKGFAIQAERYRPSQIRVVERRHLAVHHYVAIDIYRDQVADRLGVLVLDVVQHRDLDIIRRSHIDLAGKKGQDASRYVLVDRVLDTVEIGTVLFPVIRVPGYLNRLVRLEFDKFERAGADGMATHLARRHMAWIDWREPGGEQGNKGRLRPLQMEGDLKVTVRGHLFEIFVPGFTRINAKILARFAGQQVPGALDVFGGKTLAVVPCDAFPQPECQLGLVLVP